MGYKLKKIIIVLAISVLAQGCSTLGFKSDINVPSFDEERLEPIIDDPIPMRPLRLRRQLSDPLELDDDDFHRANRDFLMRDADEILFGRRPAPNVQLD